MTERPESRENGILSGFAINFFISFNKVWTSINICQRLFLGQYSKKESQESSDVSLRTKLRKTFFQRLIWIFMILITLWWFKFQLSWSVIQPGGQSKWKPALHKIKIGAPYKNSRGKSQILQWTLIYSRHSNSEWNHFLPCLWPEINHKRNQHKISHC